MCVNWKAVCGPETSSVHTSILQCCRSPLESQPWLYSYQLSSACNDVEFQTVTSQFNIINDDYNWNFLDNHICGHSDFEELGEVCIVCGNECVCLACFAISA